MICDACHEWENDDIMAECEGCGLTLCPDCDHTHLPSCQPDDQED